jgi:hypothetical protein
MYFHVDMTISNFFEETITFDNVQWEKGERYLHVFVPIEWRVKVHVLDVSASKTCPLCADCAVPKKVRGNHVSGVCGEYKWIIDQVTASSDAHTVRVFFLWTMINDNFDHM